VRLERVGKHHLERTNIHTAKMHHDILEWLSTHNFQGRYYTLRKKRVENTGDWLLQKPEFVNWVQNESDPVLCCQGESIQDLKKLLIDVVGSGKSTLA
jgi:hypothetical protein